MHSPPALPSSSSAAPRAGSPCRRGAWALLLLSAASGAADAFAFLCVGQVFAGVMTGNLVLLGASAAGAGEDGVALRVVTALAAYACGVAGGALMAGLPLRALLLGEVVLLGVAAALWGFGLVASYGERLGLLALVALAMGVQGRVRGAPTNYFTGTLTSLAGRAAAREPAPGDVWVLGRLGRWWPGPRSRRRPNGGGAPGPPWGRSCWWPGRRSSIPGGARARIRGSPGRIGGIQPGRLECVREGRSPLGEGLHGASAVRASPWAGGEARGHGPPHTHV